ncbi:NAD(P)/FAD-dependent oxidoreductase [Kitasatospora sp. NPDC006697]|uniref:NAD(P)/FAD-dependent oxidoreductase n=1 Tax=Kitasatospora sp. NPDC006697 TaxID=3364020 RepID=UPI0036A51745
MTVRRRTARHEVLVAGGGPAGAAAALALAARGRGVLLVHHPGGPPPVGEALPGAARLLLRDLGAAGSVPGEGHLACPGNRSAWGSSRVHAVDSVLDPYGPGWHLDRALFDARLRQAAQERGAVLAEGAVRSAERVADGWEVLIGQADGTSKAVRCRWIVDATGRRAALATRYGGARRCGTDRLVGLHLAVPAGPGDQGTLVESAPDGWWYSAPLPDGRLLLACFTDADLPAARADGLPDRLAETGPTRARVGAASLPPGGRRRTSPGWTGSAARGGPRRATRPPPSTRSPRRAS